tara:strand:- start:247 stop:1137 length:891 start_codon:yes stop_codon:yes gene_type:complete
MRYRSIYIVFLIVFVSSCGDFEEKPSDNQTETEKLEINPGEKISLEVGNSFFSIPSPVQIAMELQDGGKPFNPELLHNPESLENYNSEFSKSLTLGIYATDLAYCAVYGNTTQAMKYFSSMKKMADQLNASYAINESLLERFSNNMDNKDSLLSLASDAYLEIDAYLKDNNNHDVAAVVLAGGWIESMYLQSNNFKSDSSEAMQMNLAENKYTLHHFIKLIDKIGTSDDYWELKEMFVDLNSIYEEISSNYTYVAPETNSQKKTTTIKSNSSFVTSLEISNQIAEEFINLRKFYTE